MSAEIDITGHQYGQLRVVSKATKRLSDGRSVWFCKCSCGNVTKVRSNALRMGMTKSCGCLNILGASLRCRKLGKHKIHGHAGHNRKGAYRSPTYSTWSCMKQRCSNPKADSYAYYGGRGIEVCDRWLCSFKNFLEDMGVRPDAMTIDRIDSEGNYEPDNCRWATAKEQIHNRRKACCA